METKYEPVYIKIHYGKFVESLLATFVIVSSCLLLSIYGLPEWLETRIENSPKYKYPWFFTRYVLANLGLLYISPQFLWMLWRIFYIKKPSLIITKEGFTDYSSYVACGFISWKEVKNINLRVPLPPATPVGKYEKSVNIMVAVKNFKKTLQTIPFIRRKMIEIYIRFSLTNDSRFTIWMDIAQSSSDVLKTMQAYKAEYDRIRKAKKINNDV